MSDFEDIFEFDDDEPVAPIRPIRPDLDEGDDVEDFDGEDFGTDVDAEILLQRALDLVEQSRSIPLSSTVMVPKHEIVELLDDALAALPEDLKRARWLLRDQDLFIEEKKREADQMLEEARVRVQQMAAKEEVVRQARLQAAKILEEANDEARRRRHELDDYCDFKLGEMELVVDRLLKTVVAGRNRLKPIVEAGQTPLAGSEADEDSDGSGFFDNDDL